MQEGREGQLIQVLYKVLEDRKQAQGISNSEKRTSKKQKWESNKDKLPTFHPGFHEVNFSLGFLRGVISMIKPLLWPRRLFPGIQPTDAMIMTSRT